MDIFEVTNSAFLRGTKGKGISWVESLHIINVPESQRSRSCPHCGASGNLHSFFTQVQKKHVGWGC
jgi:hypothetical protein